MDPGDRRSGLVSEFPCRVCIDCIDDGQRLVVRVLSHIDCRFGMCFLSSALMNPLKTMCRLDQVLRTGRLISRVKLNGLPPSDSDMGCFR